ncbi:hypothetical protein FHS76_003473 [Ochrobactrum daejeonense]|uniref:Uncharacterized protein n=1 Tax=Brucella daejeonensis TaxID=659015 RepID=A0A7W9B039_9HYPH|nr:hypothetical protein [Brucella daejeonensis]MBB5703566.1 hypothetical protein [Brucella daejeonensis]
MNFILVWLLVGAAVYIALFLKKRRCEPKNTKAYEELPLIARILGAVFFIVVWPLALLELLSGGSNDGE